VPHAARQGEAWCGRWDSNPHDVAIEGPKEAVHDTLTSLGIDMKNITQEQQVWAFMRRFHDGTNRGLPAAWTAGIGAVATAFVGWLWFMFFGRHP